MPLQDNTIVRHSSKAHLHDSRSVSHNISNILSSTSTRSLYEGDLDYVMENGRQYSGAYFMPNDEAEQTRLQILHQVFLFFFSSRLTTTPLVNPTKILDIGTGTGDWAIGMGEIFPEAMVIGTDISAIQPTSIPHNVSFEIYDAEMEEEWTGPMESCDLVHFRGMSGSFHSWDLIYRRTLEHLKPGGWIEVVDCDTDHEDYATLFPPDSKMWSWWVALQEAMQKTGMDISPLHLTKSTLEAAGFVDVKIEEHKLPLGVWPTGPEGKSTARLWLVAVLEGMSAISLRPLTQQMGWKAEEVMEVCGQMATELRRLALDEVGGQSMGIVFKVLVGRKPRVGEQVEKRRTTEDEAEEEEDGQSQRDRGATVTQASITPKAEVSQHLQVPYEENDRTSEHTMTPERSHGGA
jgi:SAM-dependent methyltransferase